MIRSTNLIKNLDYRIRLAILLKITATDSLYNAVLNL